MERRRVTFPAERRCEKAGAAAVAPAFASSRTTGENAKVEDQCLLLLKKIYRLERTTTYVTRILDRVYSIELYPVFRYSVI